LKLEDIINFEDKDIQKIVLGMEKIHPELLKIVNRIRNIQDALMSLDNINLI